MLNLLEIRKKVYQQIHDDPNGNGAYSLEEMDDLIKLGTQIFFKESKAIQIKEYVNEKAFLQGLVEIRRFEDEEGNRIKNVKYTVVGEQLFLQEPQEAYIVWVYGGFELMNNEEQSIYNHDIRHSISLNTVAMAGIIYYILSLIFEKETNFSLANHYLQKAKEISFQFEKNFNSYYIQGVYHV